MQAWNDYRLRTKLVLSTALISALLTGSALLVVRVLVGIHIRQEASRELSGSVTTFQNFQSRSDELARITAALIADQPELKNVMTTDDPLSIQVTTAGIKEQAGVNLLVVADRVGRIMAVHADKNGLNRKTAESLLEATLVSGRTRTWWFGDGHLYRVFLHRIYNGPAAEGVTIGVLAFGEEVDRGLAEQVRDVASADVVFSQAGHPVISTLDPAMQRQFERVRLQPGLSQIELNGETFATFSMSLGPSPSDPSLNVLKSYGPMAAFVSLLNKFLLAIGFGALLAGAGLVYVISRAFTRPLSELVSGAHALEQGDYDYPLNVHGRDEAGQLTEAFGRMRSTLKNSQQTMVRAARMEAVGQLAGGVAHDFNNLITVISGFGELLLEGMEPDDPKTQYVKEITKAGARAAGLTKQLLAFSRKQVIQLRPLNLNRSLSDINRMLSVLLGSGVELSLSLGADLAEISGDPTQIDQVILNLAANARDAMSGGGHLFITTANLIVGAGRDLSNPDLAPGAYVVLTVRDTGTGMNAETRRHIFEPFFTTKEVGKGTGLGLAAVFGIVKQTNGHISVESELGHGTKFSICWPALIADVPADLGEMDTIEKMAATA